jgi:hypothetical protein
MARHGAMADDVLPALTQVAGADYLAFAAKLGTLLASKRCGQDSNLQLRRAC